MSNDLRIERRHHGKEGYHLGSGEIVCLHGEKVVGRVKYTYWETAREFRDSLAEKEPPVEGPFFRRTRAGRWVASFDIEVSKSHRKTQAFGLLLLALDEMDMPIYARFANRRLGSIFRRRYQGTREPYLQGLRPGTVVVGRPKGLTRGELSSVSTCRTHQSTHQPASTRETEGAETA